MILHRENTIPDATGDHFNNSSSLSTNTISSHGPLISFKGPLEMTFTPKVLQQARWFLQGKTTPIPNTGNEPILTSYVLSFLQIAGVSLFKSGLQCRVSSTDSGFYPGSQSLFRHFRSNIRARDIGVRVFGLGLLCWG